MDAPGRAEAAPPSELPPSGSPLSCLALAAAPRRLARSLRRSLSWTCHQVALSPLDSSFLGTYCVYLLWCFSINVLLSLL